MGEGCVQGGEKGSSVRDRTGIAIARCGEIENEI